MNNVIHLWNYDSDTPADLIDPSFIKERQYFGFFSLLFLIKTIGIEETISIWFVTADARRVGGSSGASLAVSTAFGLCKVIPQEYPMISCRCIDFSLRDFDPDLQCLQLLAEIVSPSDSPEVAYRGLQRWLSTTVQITSSERQPPAFRKNGVYLITGGLGRIGLTIAEYLTKKYETVVILLSRHATEGASNHTFPTDGRHAKLRQISNQFGGVKVVQGDVTDLVRMKDLIETLKNSTEVLTELFMRRESWMTTTSA